VIAVKLRKLCFLVHGFCHAELARGNPEAREKMREYLERENSAAGRWLNAIRCMKGDEGLAIIPWPHDGKGPAAAFETEAREILGERCFVLDTPLWNNEAFWKGRQAKKRRMIRELSSAFLGQRHSWNMEELETGLHSLNASLQLAELMDDRACGLSSGISAEGWGAAFEGCVMKYCGNLTRLLDLPRPIEVEFEMSIPDAGFILGVSRWERIALGDSMRCFLFGARGRLYGLLATTVQSVGHPALEAEVPLDPETTTVIDKFGARLWPEPSRDGLPRSELGYREPVQALVGKSKGGLRIPVNGGLVYRRAKAPAYVIPESTMGWEEFGAIMSKARARARPPQFI
jgi:hypothetical protein